MAGDVLELSTIVASSMMLGKRQPEPGKLAALLLQYVIGASHDLIVASSCFCHIRPVTLHSVHIKPLITFQVKD
jgi:hypothetical protein